MKIYSDTLQRSDLGVALIAAGLNDERVYVDECMALPSPRLRQRGWKVRLTCTRSNRHRNSGTHGAATWEMPAASWDQHGRWMAELFERDPNARISNYNGRDDFHRATKGKYRPKTTSLPA